jgi:hypothetical protein
MVPPTIKHRPVILACAAIAAALVFGCSVGNGPRSTPTPEGTAIAQGTAASPSPPATQPLPQTSANVEFSLSITRSDHYVWPAQGAITSYFGAGHPTGIDIALDLNADSPIKAAGDGHVVFAGGDPCCSLGNHIEIEHAGGVKTVYGHLSSIDVAEGQDVKQGDVIGLGGSSGDADGKHLHFEMYQDGAAVDPFRYLPADQQAVSGNERVSCAESAIRVDPDSELKIRLLPRSLTGYEIQTVAYTGLTTTARSLSAIAARDSILIASLKMPPLGAATGETIDAGLDIVLIATGQPDQQVSCRLTMRTRQTLPNPPGTGDRHVAGAEGETPVPTATPTRTPISGPISAPVKQPTPNIPVNRQPTPRVPVINNPSPQRPPVQSP